MKKEDQATLVTYHTPVGSASCKYVYTEEMEQAGVSIAWITEHVIKNTKDYKPVGYIFRNMKLHRDYGNYLEFQESVGDKGIAVAFGNLVDQPYASYHEGVP